MGDYPCQNAGCVGDGTFNMTQEQEYTHFTTHGNIDPPKNCYTCRWWIDKQKSLGTQFFVCTVCEARFPVTYERRFHALRTEVEGWQVPPYCGPCTADPKRRQQKLRDQAADKRQEDRARRREDKLYRAPVELTYAEIVEAAVKEVIGSLYTSITPLSILDDIEAYKRMPVRSRHSDAIESRYSHIADHSDDINAVLGGKNMDSAIQEIAWMAGDEADPAHTAEFTFKQGSSSYIVKLDKTSGFTAVYRLNNTPPPDGIVTTAYTKNNAKTVVAKIEEGEWIPQR